MSYIGNKPLTQAEKKTQQHTTTASKTVYPVSGGYSVGLIDVFLNGVLLLDSTDYIATDGLNVQLIIATSANDTLVTVAWGSFSVADVQAITESGNNANGYYVKWDDGTMMCWFLQTATTALVWTFPQPFISAPVLTGAFPFTSTTQAGGVHFDLPSATSVNVQAWFITIANSSMVWTSNSHIRHLTATGRWK